MAVPHPVAASDPGTGLHLHGVSYSTGNYWEIKLQSHQTYLGKVVRVEFVMKNNNNVI